MFQEVIKATVNKVTSNSSLNSMQTFIQEVLIYHDKPVHSLTELKEHRNTKIKGDLFEMFCKKYLEKHYKSVWLLKEIPVHVLNQVGMIGSDFGIDILVQDIDGYFSAVQCKFKGRNNGKKAYCVTWKELSTFYALCARLENNKGFKFKHHIVITTADSCRRIGKKTTQDLSICYKTLCNLKLMDFIEMLDQVIPTIQKDASEKQTLREARLKYFANLM